MPPYGSALGIHAIYPQITIPLVRQAKEQGAAWPLVKGVDNAGIALDVKAISPATLTITRFVNSRWDSFQNGWNWTSVEGDTAAIQSIQLIFDRTNAEERRATDRFEIVNEADPPGWYGWQAYGRWLIRLIDEAEVRGIRLCLPAFNFGTPEWDEMVALVETGVFARMQAGGHWLAVHEGVRPFSDEPFVFGPIPGAPFVPNAGPLVYRYRYLYRLLEQRGEVVPLVVSEFYAGGGYNWDRREFICNRLFQFDREVRKDPYVLAVLPFTVDPNDDWQDQNYNPFYADVLQYLVSEKDKPNVTTYTVADISKHNSQHLGGNTWLPANFRIDIDFEAVKRSNIAGLILRVGYGELKDPCFDRYVDFCEQNDIAWAIYHYFLPQLDPHRQADLVRQWCVKHPRLGVYADFEDDPAPYFGDALFERHDRYLLRLDHNFNVNTGIYSRASYMDALFDLQDQYTWRHRRGWWAAPGALVPNVPAGWLGLDPKYTLHQYTWAGIWPGFPRPLDLNRTAPGAPLSVLFDDSFDEGTHYMAYLSHRNKDDELLNRLDSIQVAIDIDLNSNVLGVYYPHGEEPTPEPTPPPANVFPRQMLTKTPLNLRDVRGNVMPGTVPAGVPVTVHMVLSRIGPNNLNEFYEDRAVLAVDGRNVWFTNLETIP